MAPAGVLGSGVTVDCGAVATALTTLTRRSSAEVRSLGRTGAEPTEA